MSYRPISLDGVTLFDQSMANENDTFNDASLGSTGFSDTDSGCILLDYAWMPSGLSTDQVQLYMLCLPDEKIPYAGSIGERYRAEQLLYQLPPQDFELRYCQSVGEDEKDEFLSFGRRRKDESLGTGTVKQVTDELIEDLVKACPSPPPLSMQQSLTCERCQEAVKVGDLAVFIVRAPNPMSCWHPACFVCDTCQHLLVDLTYLHSAEEDRIYCGRHHAELLKPRCEQCDEIIFSEECTEAEGTSWHTRHFCCVECERRLGGDRYVMSKEEVPMIGGGSGGLITVSRPHCCSCFNRKYSEKCQTCQQLITVDEPQMTFQDGHWHATDECFNCQSCHQSLIGRAFVHKHLTIFCTHECASTAAGASTRLSTPPQDGTDGLSSSSYHPARRLRKFGEAIVTDCSSATGVGTGTPTTGRHLLTASSISEGDGATLAAGASSGTNNNTTQSIISDSLGRMNISMSTTATALSMATSAATAAPTVPARSSSEGTGTPSNSEEASPSKDESTPEGKKERKEDIRQESKSETGDKLYNTQILLSREDETAAEHSKELDAGSLITEEDSTAMDGDTHSPAAFGGEKLKVENSKILNRDLKDEFNSTAVDSTSVSSSNVPGTSSAATSSIPAAPPTNLFVQEFVSLPKFYEDCSVRQSPKMSRGKTDLLRLRGFNAGVTTSSHTDSLNDFNNRISNSSSSAAAVSGRGGDVSSRRCRSSSLNTQSYSDNEANITATSIVYDKVNFKPVTGASAGPGSSSSSGHNRTRRSRASASPSSGNASSPHEHHYVNTSVATATSQFNAQLSRDFSNQPISVNQSAESRGYVNLSRDFKSDSKLLARIPEYRMQMETCLIGEDQSGASARTKSPQQQQSVTQGNPTPAYTEPRQDPYDHILTSTSGPNATTDGDAAGDGSSPFCKEGPTSISSHDTFLGEPSDLDNLSSSSSAFRPVGPSFDFAHDPLHRHQYDRPRHLFHPQPRPPHHQHQIHPQHQLQHHHQAHSHHQSYQQHQPHQNLHPSNYDSPTSGGRELIAPSPLQRIFSDPPPDTSFYTQPGGAPPPPRRRQSSGGVAGGVRDDSSSPASHQPLPLDSPSGSAGGGVAGCFPQQQQEKVKRVNFMPTSTVRTVPRSQSFPIPFNRGADEYDDDDQELEPDEAYGRDGNVGAPRAPTGHHVRGASASEAYEEYEEEIAPAGPDNPEDEEFYQRQLVATRFMSEFERRKIMENSHQQQQQSRGGGVGAHHHRTGGGDKSILKNLQSYHPHHETGVGPTVSPTIALPDGASGPAADYPGYCSTCSSQSGGGDEAGPGGSSSESDGDDFLFQNVTSYNRVSTTFNSSAAGAMTSSLGSTSKKSRGPFRSKKFTKSKSKDSGAALQKGKGRHRTFGDGYGAGTGGGATVSGSSLKRNKAGGPGGKNDCSLS